MEITFRPFESGDQVAFGELNEAWISALLSMEEKDRELLGDPVRHILNEGGAIFMAVSGERAVGCCALLKMDGGAFELGKMAVAEDLRGAGIGRQLLEFVIGKAREMGITRLFLETNHKLQNAIHLYEAAGFKHVPGDRLHPSPYARSDVSMELVLPIYQTRPITLQDLELVCRHRREMFREMGSPEPGATF